MNDGVTVEADVHAIAVAVEPDFAALPSWLGITVPEDRLLGSVLALHASRPTSPVVLVTEVNLCNKADPAQVPTVDPPTW